MKFEFNWPSGFRGEDVVAPVALFEQTLEDTTYQISRL